MKKKNEKTKMITLSNFIHKCSSLNNFTHDIEYMSYPSDNCVNSQIVYNFNQTVKKTGVTDTNNGKQSHNCFKSDVI